MMKVLHVIDQLTVGGAEVLTINTVNLLANQPEFEVHLCVTRKESALKESMNGKVKYTFLEKKKTLDFTFYKRLFAYVREQKIDIIHAHNTSYLASAIVKFFSRRKLKLVWHNHTGAYVNLAGTKFRVLKFISRSFDVIFNVNYELNNWSKLKLNAKDNYVLNNFASFNNEDKITKLRGEVGKRFVCLAGLRRVKDHLNLINAFEEVLKDHPDWTLHLIGKNYGDDYADEVVEMILDKNLGEKVFFYGLRHDIKNILSQATIGMLVSKKEGFPISVLEYGLAGLPVILTDVGNNRNIVQDHRAIVAPNNYEELADKMDDMIQDEKMRSEIAVSLHQQVSSSFSEEHYINELKKVYLKI